MTSWKAARGHRRTKRASEGDPRKVRQMRARRTETRDACRFPAECGCVACRPDPYDETDDRS